MRLSVLFYTFRPVPKNPLRKSLMKFFRNKELTQKK